MKLSITVAGQHLFFTSFPFKRIIDYPHRKIVYNFSTFRKIAYHCRGNLPMTIFISIYLKLKKLYQYRENAVISSDLCEFSFVL